MFGMYRDQAEYFGAMAATQRARESREKDNDADRRHSRRSMAIQEAIRSAVASHGEVFSAEAPVPEMTAAAVAVYERANGR